MSRATVVVVVEGAVEDATVVVGTMVVGIVEAEVELATDVLVGDMVTVVVDDAVVETVDGTSVACPVVEQATNSSRDPTSNRIGIP